MFKIGFGNPILKDWIIIRTNGKPLAQRTGLQNLTNEMTNLD